MQGSSLSEAVFTEEETDVGSEEVDVDCSGLNILVMLVNASGQNVAKRICRNVDPTDCVEDKCIGADNVGVLIMEPLEGMMDMGWMFSLRTWPVTCVFHQRYTLAHHLLVSNRRQHVQTTVLERRRKEGKRTYVTSRTTTQTRPTKKSQILNNNSIHQPSATVCCDSDITRKPWPEQQKFNRFMLF